MTAQSSTLAIGIDVGGTKTAVVVMSPSSGEVVDSVVIDTDAREGEAHLHARLRIVLDELRAQHGEEIPTGVGLPELVFRDGTVLTDVVVPGLAGDLRDRWADLGVVAVEADVRAAAIAEARFGNGKGMESFAYISVGTGISFCFVVDGQPWAGHRGAAILLGSGLIVAGEAESSSLEEFAGGPAILAAYRNRGGIAQRTHEVMERANAGSDPIAVDVVTTAGRALGRGVAEVANLLDPQVVILGGGLGVTHGLYWDVAEASARAGIWADAARGLAIMRSATGAQAGAIGAALAATAVG